MKITFASVPSTTINEGPIMAPALLKAIANKHGHSSVAIDINAELNFLIKTHPREQELLSYFIKPNGDTTLGDEVVILVEHFTKRLMDTDAEIIGLSLLHHQCQHWTEWLCNKLKSWNPNIQIIIGGAGIKSSMTVGNNSWCENLKSSGKIDHYISGDAEESLVEFFKGNLDYPGINTDQWKQVDSLDNHPYPDYSDYNFDLYKIPTIPIVDSRGCVRACEFCDVIEFWKKFQWRSADCVFKEMLYQIDQYNITHFSLMSSLTNGNMKEFNKWLDHIVTYNESKPRDQQISWSGYFIVRDSAHHPESLWKKLAASNAKLSLGVESVIQRVRYGLGKKFSNEDIDYHLEMGQKYNVFLELLLIAGYPSETIEDYAFTKQWLIDRLPYAKNPIHEIQISPFVVINDTGIVRDKDKYSLWIPKDRPWMWMNQNLKITPQVRDRYLLELLDIAKTFNQTYHETHIWLHNSRRMRRGQQRVFVEDNKHIRK